MDTVTTADFKSHDSIKRPAKVPFHHSDRLYREGRVCKPFLPDQGGAHIRQHSHQSVIIKRHWIDKLDGMSIPVELSHIQQLVVGVATATGPQNPCAKGKRFDVCKTEDAAS
jgi:hypothetical protein